MVDPVRVSSYNDGMIEQDSDLRIFYVYEHWRTDKNQCFYVGKGHGKRAYLVNRARNRFHGAIVNKLKSLGLSVEVRILQSGMTEDESFSAEIALIAKWKSEGVELTNAGAGGEGNFGRAAYNRKRVVCLETLKSYDSTTNAGQEMNISSVAVGDVCRERYRSVMGFHFVYSDGMPSRDQAAAMIRDIEIRLAKRRRRGGKVDPSVGVTNGRDATGRSAAGPMKNARPVLCLDDGERYPSASSAARAYNVSKSAVVQMCLGNKGRLSVSGFRFQYEKAA